MQPPEILGGRYELRGVLGRGGMAEVRDGWDRRLDRPVAIKLLHPAVGAQPEQRTRFEGEARAAAALNHPNLVAVHDSGEHDGIPYIVMERLPGRTLGDAIAQGPLPWFQVRLILDHVLSALATAHAAGILHRDIKPANILFTERGEAKVADFGIAKSGDAVQTMAGQVFGTMAYLTPERIAGHPATVSDDLYAVGVVGYEALTGRRAFPQENLVELARAVAEQPVVPLQQLRPDVDPNLAATIERAMARDPHWRFTSAQEMRDALAGASPAGPPVPPPGRPPTRVLAQPLPPPTMLPVSVAPGAPRRPYGRLLTVAAALLALVLGLVVMVAESSSQPSAPQPVSTSTPVPTTTVPSITSLTPALTTEPPVAIDPGAGQGPGPKPGRGNDKGPKPGDDD
ncbi:serine/threonine protein kinase [Mycolicibacterium sp. S2-37]|uniref:serine/threonine-protein kinase n=1 Tax=Mycolicibacterium sp. S2-37 TaxID=2810297 RepID=UPI001A952547|nr:serine/threonine-protein kinase [Mycolicibacterium sp. S2-37]MBO0680180.1 serine/threonine protein kinase [Mycolicibacterium sp. S2-37]